MEFSKVPRLVESGKFLKRKVDISGNFKLVDLSKSFRFQFRV